MQKKQEEEAKHSETRAIRRAETRKWTRLAVAAGLLVAAFGYVNYVRVQARATAENLLNSNTADLPKLLPNLNHFWADSLLKEAAAGDDPKRKLNASLALLPSDPAFKDYIAERLPEAAPALGR